MVVDSLTTKDLRNFFFEGTKLRFCNNEEVVGLENIGKVYTAKVFQFPKIWRGTDAILFPN